MTQFALGDVEGSEFLIAGQNLVEGAKAGLFVAAIEILALALMYTPEDTGVLRRSGRVDDFGLARGAKGAVSRDALGQFAAADPYATVGFGYGDEINPKTGHVAAQYAVPVHERLDQRHEPPTQAKFLETAVYEYSGSFGPTIAEMMQGIEDVSGPTILKAFVEWEDLVAMRAASSGEHLA